MTTPKPASAPSATLLDALLQRPNRVWEARNGNGMVERYRGIVIDPIELKALAASAQVREAESVPVAQGDDLLRECYEWLFESKSDGPRVSEGALAKGYYTPDFHAFHDRLLAALQGATR